MLLAEGDRLRPRFLGQLVAATGVLGLDVGVDGVLTGKCKRILAKLLEPALGTLAALLEVDRSARVDAKVGDPKTHRH